MFAFEEVGVVPDFLTLSKTLGRGSPLSTVVASEDVAAKGKEGGFGHYTSHSSDSLLATIGLAVGDVIVGDGLADRGSASATGC